MPPLRISTPNLGGVSLLNWLQEPTNVQPVIQIDDTIYPVMEQFRFQERWFYFIQTITLTVNQRVLWRFECPIDESWNIDIIAFVHQDSTPNDVVVSIVAADGQDGIGDIINKEIQPGFSTLLYPSRSLQNNIATSIGGEFASQELIILPLERLEIVTSPATAAGPTVFSLRVRYRRRPVPIEGPRLSPVLAEVIVV